MLHVLQANFRPDGVVCQLCKNSSPIALEHTVSDRAFPLEPFSYLATGSIHKI
jgi:hypothetical protein